MSPNTRQALRNSGKNILELEKVPLLEPTNDMNELEATKKDNTRDRYQSNGGDSESSYSNSQMMIRMRLRPGPNGPRLSFVTCLKERSERKSQFRKIRSHVESTHPEEKRRDWMRRLRLKPHRYIS